MAVNAFTCRQDQSTGYTSYLRIAPTYIDMRVLAANTAETVTAPTGAKIVIFSSNSDFYVNPNGTAAISATDVTDGTGSEMNPSGYTLNGATFSIIAPAACNVTMAFYS